MLCKSTSRNYLLLVFESKLRSQIMEIFIIEKGRKNKYCTYCRMVYGTAVLFGNDYGNQPIDKIASHLLFFQVVSQLGKPITGSFSIFSCMLFSFCSLHRRSFFFVFFFFSRNCTASKFLSLSAGVNFKTHQLTPTTSQSSIHVGLSLSFTFGWLSEVSRKVDRINYGINILITS